MNVLAASGRAGRDAFASKPLYSRTVRAQTHAILPEAVGAGLHTALPLELHFSIFLL